VAGEAETKAVTTTPPSSVDRAWDELLRMLLADILPRVPIDILTDSVVEPTRVLLEALAAADAAGLAEWAGGASVDVPAAGWRRLREARPALACFPLGSPTERATKRCLVGLVRSAARSGREDARRDSPGPGRVLRAYLALWLFEVALVDLRGSCDRLERDYGFLYHFLPDGQLRPASDEAELRRGLLGAARRMARAVTEGWAAPRGRAVPDPRALVRALQQQVNVPFRRPASRAPGVAVLGLSREAASLAPRDVDRRAARHIYFHGAGANGRLDIGELVAACGGGLDPRVADLIDIAATAYLADIYIPRDTLMARDLGFVIAVRQPGLWTRHAEAVSRPLSFLSLNPVNMRFVPLVTTDGVAKRALPRQASEGTVSLFSGGLDSFACASQLAARGQRALLVSHDPGAMVHGIQQRLARALRARRAADGRANGSLTAVSVPVRADRQAPPINRLGDPPGQVLYQYTRSFLFLSLATAVALHNGLREVLVPENGPVSLNPAFSEARTNTRTTHPRFLAEFARLAADVFGVEIVFRNPFELLTKGEVLAAVDPARHEWLRHTNSCWSYSKVKLWAKDVGHPGFTGGHCGRCLPCIWRRAAMRRAGLANSDDVYLWDHVPAERRGKWISRRHLTVLLDQLRFCRNVLALPVPALLDLCPDLLEGQGRFAERLALVRRFSSEVVDYFRNDARELMKAGIRYHLTSGQANDLSEVSG
jgi:7-cyano-7-deazaguanine synthase in queuosine biosynthesis